MFNVIRLTRRLIGGSNKNFFNKKRMCAALDLSSDGWLAVGVPWCCSAAWNSHGLRTGAATPQHSNFEAHADFQPSHAEVQWTLA